MGDTPEENPFTYDAFAKVDADWLRATAVALSLRMRRTVKDMLEAGGMLAKARRRLGRDQWPRWLAKEAQVPARSAHRLVSVASVFEKIEPDVLERFTPTALYVLAESSTPKSLREYAVEQATEGESVTATLVQEWIMAYRDNPLISSDVKRQIKEAHKNDHVTPVDVDPNEVHAAENWQLLDKLLGKEGSIHLAASCDSDPQIGDRWIFGTYTKPATETEPAIRRTATHNNLERVILSLVGMWRQKECPRCSKTKSLDEFSKRKDREDGRNSYCLSCERQRVKNFEENRRAKAKQTTAA